MQPNLKAVASSTICFTSYFFTADYALVLIKFVIYFNATSTKSFLLFVSIFLNEGIGFYESICTVTSSYSKLNFFPNIAGSSNYVSAIERVSAGLSYVVTTSFHITTFFYFFSLANYFLCNLNYFFTLFIN